MHVDWFVYSFFRIGDTKLSKRLEEKKICSHDKCQETPWIATQTKSTQEVEKILAYVDVVVDEVQLDEDPLMGPQRHLWGGEKGCPRESSKCFS